MPRLQVGRSALAASLIMAVLRTGWHLPLFLYGTIPVSDIVFIIAAQIVISWLFNSTGGSVLVVMALHLLMNVCGEYFAPLFSGGDALTFAWLRAGLFSIVAIGLIIWAGPTRLSRRSLALPEAVSEPVVRL